MRDQEPYDLDQVDIMNDACSGYYGDYADDFASSDESSDESEQDCLDEEEE